MNEELVKAVAALGEYVEILKEKIELKEFALKREKEAHERVRKELAELKSEKIKAFLDEG